MDRGISSTIPSAKVASLFDTMTPAQRELAMKLRQIIVETAQNTEDCGPLVEGVKWGEAAYFTSQPSTGSTVRIAPVKGEADKVGLFFICTSGLVEHFRQHYDDVLEFAGNRAIHFKCGKELPVAEISHCVALALTRNLWKG